MGSKRYLSPLVEEQAKNEQLEAEKATWRTMAILFMIATLALALLLIGTVYVNG